MPSEQSIFQPYSLLGKKIRLPHWTECHFLVRDIGVECYYGLIQDGSGRNIVFEALPKELPWEVMGEVWPQYQMN